MERVLFFLNFRKSQICSERKSYRSGIHIWSVIHSSGVHFGDNLRDELFFHCLARCVRSRTFRKRSTAVSGRNRVRLFLIVVFAFYDSNVTERPRKRLLIDGNNTFYARVIIITITIITVTIIVVQYYRRIRLTFARKYAFHWAVHATRDILWS